MMKRFCFLFALKFLLISAFAATATIPYVDVTFSALPVDGNTVTINGNARTFKTTVSSPSSQVLIGATAADTAQNYFTQVRLYPYDFCNSSGPHGTTVKVWGNLSASMTASKTGAWGTVTVQSQNADAFTFQVSLLAIDSALRAPRANTLLTNLQDMATITLAANSAFMANFANLSTAQTINGAKTFPGANVYSNASQLFALGFVSNTVLTNIPIANVGTLIATTNLAAKNVYVTNGTPFIYLVSTVGPTDSHKTYVYSAPTEFAIQFQDDASTTFSNVFQIGRSGNAGTLATFTVPVVAPLFTGIFTGSATNSVLHATSLFADTSWMRGIVTISNAVPELSFYDTNGAANAKWWRMRGESTGFTFSIPSDDGTDNSAHYIMTVSRPGDGITGADALVSFIARAEFQNGLEISTGNLLTPDVMLAGSGLIVGDYSTSMPSGLIGAYFFDGTAPAADPATGFGFWSQSGNLLYRSSAASEGSGQANHVHNRQDAVFGSGTDYTLTASTAAIDFGTTDPRITLPTEGTYEIIADVAYFTGTTASDSYRFKLRNETLSADLTGSDFETTQFGTTAVETTAHLVGTVSTGSPSNVIAIWGHNNTGARGTVRSARTRIRYVRLY